MERKQPLDVLFEKITLLGGVGGGAGRRWGGVERAGMGRSLSGRLSTVGSSVLKPTFASELSPCLVGRLGGASKETKLCSSRLF